ncbi:MAG: hypothetical protein IJH61_04970 [Eubacteriaceae bacterium]|nr:hypothetical protein [Eubacteriaceae bacterium]
MESGVFSGGVVFSGDEEEIMSQINPASAGFFIATQKTFLPRREEAFGFMI